MVSTERMILSWRCDELGWPDELAARRMAQAVLL